MRTQVMLTVFTVRYGGPTHAATLTAVIDMAGFVVSVPLVFLAGLDFSTGNVAPVIASIALLHTAVQAFHLAFAVLELREPGEPSRPAVDT